MTPQVGIARPSSSCFSGNSAPGFSVNPCGRGDTAPYLLMHTSLLSLCQRLGFSVLWGESPILNEAGRASQTVGLLSLTSPPPPMCAAVRLGFSSPYESSYILTSTLGLPTVSPTVLDPVGKAHSQMNSQTHCWGPELVSEPAGGPS